MREAIGKRIADARKRANKTQAQLATEVGVDSQTISKIERGLQTPMGTTLRGLAESLGVSSSWLLLTEEAEENAEDARTRVTEQLPAAAKHAIDEYLQSSHGRSAPIQVKARLRSGAIFASMGVTEPGWRDIDDLRNILERQASADRGLSPAIRDKPTPTKYADVDKALRKRQSAKRAKARQRPK